MNLPVELVENVYSFLEWKEVIACRRVCKVWRAAEKAEWIWAIFVRPLSHLWPSNEICVSPRRQFRLTVLFISSDCRRVLNGGGNRYLCFEGRFSKPIVFVSGSSNAPDDQNGRWTIVTKKR